MRVTSLSKQSFPSGINFAMIIMLSLAIILTGTPFKAQAAEKTGAAMIPASFSEIADKASPSVVNISTVRKRVSTAPGGSQMPFNDPNMREFFERYFNGPMPRRQFKQHSMGTGFIIEPSGLIVTNNHVVEGADDIKVKMSNGKEYEAKIIGTDPKTDIALIKIKAKVNLPHLELGDSGKLKVGDWLVAIGNPFGLEHTVTAGILSARGRVIGAGPYDDFLQTDTSINPGNSGGPLLNLAGEVIGINTAIVPSGQGIGFAIPADLAKGIVDQLKDNGKVVRGWLGVMIQGITPELAKSFDLDETYGALVADVTENGPAEKAGIKRGDVIVGFDGKKVEESSDLPAMVAGTPVGSRIDVEVIRNGKEKTIQVKLGELEDRRQASLPVKNGGLGLDVTDLTPELAKRLGLSENKGVVITKIREGSPAGESQLKPGDLIMEINRNKVENTREYRKATDDIEEGDSVLFLVKRGGNTLFFTMDVTS